MFLRSLRCRLATIPVALLAVAGLAVATAVPASATTISWSNTSDIFQSDGSAAISSVATTADGTQYVVSQARQAPNRNTNGLAMLKRGANSFDPPVWIVNAPTDPPSGDHSVAQHGMDLFASGNDLIAVWMSEPADGSTTLRALAASRYSNGVWSAPAYLDLASGAPTTDPGYALMADGSVITVIAAADATLQTAIFGTNASWGSLTTVPGAAWDPNDYAVPSVTIALDGTIWIAYPDITGNPSVVSSAGASWTTPIALGHGDPNYSDNFVIAMANDGFGGQRPVVAFSESPIGPGLPSLQIAARGADGTWTNQLIATNAVAQFGLALGVAPDGSMSLAAADYNGPIVLTSSPGFGMPWTTPVDIAPLVPGTPNIINLALASNTRGDIVIAIPTAFGVGPDYGEVWLAGVRAGSGVITGPTLLSTETPGESQGAVALTITLSDTDNSAPVAWSSFNSNPAGIYGLFWMDAASSFPNVPGVPTVVTAVAGTAGVVLTCTAPANPGSSAITAYDYRYSTDGGSTWSEPVAIGSSPCGNTIAGLSAGTYIFQVRAVNATGTGAWSIATSPTTVAGEVTPAFTG